MKTLRRMLALSVLVFTLTLSASAGDMHTGAPEPGSTPVNTQGEISTGVAGEITTMNADAEVAEDSVTEVALSLIQSVLSLF